MCLVSTLDDGEKRMNIRLKMSIVIIIMTFLSMISIIVISQNVLVSSYEEIESEMMEKNLNRLESAIKRELSDLASTSNDWGAWDDTYEFIIGNLPEYPVQNIYDSVFVNLRLNYMIFVNESGKIYYTQAYDFVDLVETEVPKDLISIIENGSLLINHIDENSIHCGLVYISKDPMLVSSRAIVRSDYSGPIGGSIIMGRYLDDAERFLLENLTELNIAFEYFDTIDMPLDFTVAKDSLEKNDSSIFIYPMNDTTIAGYFIFNDIDQNPSIIFRIQMQRDIVEQGKTTLFIFHMMFSIWSVIFVLVMMYAIDRNILRRVFTLKKEFIDIEKSNDFSSRVSLYGNDELSSLSSSINSALLKLENIHRDLDDLNKNLEEKVQERTSEVNHLLKQKNDFINQLGHDLKNPLGPIINLLPVLEKDETDAHRRKTFEVLIRNVNHIKNLVLKTIQLSQLNAPTTKMNLEETQLTNELDAVIGMNRPSYENRNIEIDNRVDDSIIVHTDKLQIKELFDNLINNAVKFSPHGGTITIDAEKDKDAIIVSVKDMGIGITQEQLSHMFDEFYKADQSRHDFDSSGLGLPICKRIVEKHGGRIWVESEGLGKGTTIFFTLPFTNRI
jgi:signal transduction histidine kinase